MNRGKRSQSLSERIEAEMLTTEQAAEMLDVTRARVLVLIAGRKGKAPLSPQIPATVFGQAWMIHREDLLAFAAIDRPAHRPRKK